MRTSDERQTLALRRFRRSARWSARALSAVCLIACSDGSDPTDEGPPLPGYEPDPTLVSVPADPSRVVEIPRHPGVRAPVDLALLRLREGESPATADRVAGLVSATVAGGIRDLQIYQLQLPTRSLEALDAALATLRDDPAVETVGYDLVLALRDCPAESDVSVFEPPVSCPWESTGFRDTTTVIEELEVPLAPVLVGLVDSGIRRRNGEFDDLRLIDARAAGGRPDALGDERGHGTKVAGVLAADDGDGGLNGFASRVLGDQLGLVVSPVELSGEPVLVASQLMVATQRTILAGATIVNWSLGLEEPFVEAEMTDEDRAARALIRQLAINRSNVLFVAAARNVPGELTGANDFPAGIALPNVITVGSHMSCMPKMRAPDSSSGPRVEITAQGEAVPVIGVDNGSVWTAGFGSSFSTPQVTSLAAILSSIDPTLSAAELKRRILEGAQEGPPSTAMRSLELARPVLRLLREFGPDPVIDADDDGSADRTGAVITRVCGGSAYSVDGFGSHVYPAEPEDGVVVSGNLAESGFGLFLRRPGSNSLGLLCEGCAFELGTFPISEEGPATAAYTRGALRFGAGGVAIGGAWTIEACAIVERFPEELSPNNTPFTVMLSSTAEGQMEAGDGSMEEPVVVDFRGSFEVPVIVEPLPPEHPLVETVESTCEGGRAR